MDRLNYFAPYESKKSWHEDQLTRAFLVVLRYVPMAQAVFLEVDDRIAYQLPRAMTGVTSAPVSMVNGYTVLHNFIISGKYFSVTPESPDSDYCWVLHKQ